MEWGRTRYLGCYLANFLLAAQVEKQVDWQELVDLQGKKEERDLCYRMLSCATFRKIKVI